MQPIYELPKLTSPALTQNLNQTIIILGTSANGPVLEPVLISNLEMASSIFGEFGNLYKGFKQAYEVNNQIPIYLMRVSGSAASGYLLGITTQLVDEEEEDVIDSIIKIESIYGGDVYNQISFIIEEDLNNDYYLKIYFPDALNKQNIAYKLTDLTTVNELVKAINTDSYINKNYIKASTTNQDYLILDLIAMNANNEIFLENGKDEINLSKNDLFLRFEEAYELLNGFEVNIIIPLEVYFDDFYEGIINNINYYGSYTYNQNRDYLSLIDSDNNQFVTFHGQLIRFCKNQLDVGIMTHGVISMSMIEDLTELEEDSYLIDWINSTPIQSRYDLTHQDIDGYIDDGKYITIVLGDIIYNKDLPSQYRFPWNACYGAMIASMGYDQTTTNKVIPKTGDFSYDIDNQEINHFANLGIVCPRVSVRNGVVVSNGVTAAISTDAMHYIVNVRQVQIAMNQLNKAVDIYKGEAIQPLINNNTLEKLIDSTLKDLKNQGLLIDYRYNLEYDKNSSSGIIKVDLLTKNMIEYVATQAQLSLT